MPNIFNILKNVKNYSKKISIGEKIRDARKEANLTQAELADLIHISRNQLINYEQDLISPPVDKFIKIADACHISPQELLPEENLIPTQK